MKFNDFHSPATLGGAWESLSCQFSNKSCSVYHIPPASDYKLPVGRRQSLDQSLCVYPGPYTPS